MPRRDLQNLVGLLQGELRVTVEQPRRVIQRDFQSADRIRPSAHFESSTPFRMMFLIAIRKRSCPLVKFTTARMR
jgi:hypothetical protein